MKAVWHGYTYPKILQYNPTLWLWKKLCCKKGMHLWDEVMSDCDHYLYCDACGISLELNDES